MKSSLAILNCLRDDNDSNNGPHRGISPVERARAAVALPELRPEP
jgi:hypothetical protein